MGSLHVWKGIFVMIYFLQESAGNLIKIGFTSREEVEERVSELERLVHSEISILLTMEGDRKKESELHEYFDKYRSIGEWFSPSPEIISFILATQKSQLKTKNGCKKFINDGGFHVFLICPQCGFENCHLGNIRSVGDEDTKITVYGECWHVWEITLNNHKGNIYVEYEVIEDHSECDNFNCCTGECSCKEVVEVK